MQSYAGGGSRTAFLSVWIMTH